MAKAKKKIKSKAKKLKKTKPAKRRKVFIKKKIKKPVKHKKVLTKRKIKLKTKKVRLSYDNLKKKKIAVKKIIRRKKPVVKKEKPVAKPTKVAPAREFPAETFFKARIKVIGVGGGGGSIVSEIGRSLPRATFVIADTDIRALKKKSGIKYFWFGQELTHGLGTGVDVDLAKQAAEQVKEKISENFKDQDIIIFIASLGGGLGSGATQIFAEAAKEFGGITFGIFTMPFKFEGKNKQKIAQNALKTLRKSLNVSLAIPNERIFKIIDAQTPITQAFSMVNKSLIESLESLIDLIYNPGIINIDFADLRSILMGRGNIAFLNTVEETGKDRAEKICQNILHNPLLLYSGFAAEKILFNITGADNLSMFEVEKISSHIAKLNPKAKIIFGISKSPKLKNKIKTTILMTGGADGEELPTKIIEPIIIEKNVDNKTEIKQEKPAKKISKNKSRQKSNKKQKAASQPEEGYSLGLPVFEVPVPGLAVPSVKKISIANPQVAKKVTRRSGLEIKKAEEQEEKKKIDQEKEWEIPAFLRRVKFKS
jgi:cell division protein FtsZ